MKRLIETCICPYSLPPHSSKPKFAEFRFLKDPPLRKQEAARRESSVRRKARMPLAKLDMRELLMLVRAPETSCNKMSVRFVPRYVAVDCKAVARVPPDEVITALKRHVRGDWGDVPQGQIRKNDNALSRKMGLLRSWYRTTTGIRVGIDSVVGTYAGTYIGNPEQLAFMIEFLTGE